MRIKSSKGFKQMAKKGFTRLRNGVGCFNMIQSHPRGAQLGDGVPSKRSEHDAISLTRDQWGRGFHLRLKHGEDSQIPKLKVCGVMVEYDGGVMKEGEVQ